MQQQYWGVPYRTLLVGAATGAVLLVGDVPDHRRRHRMYDVGINDDLDTGRLARRLRTLDRWRDLVV